MSDSSEECSRATPSEHDVGSPMVPQKLPFGTEQCAAIWINLQALCAINAEQFQDGFPGCIIAHAGQCNELASKRLHHFAVE